MEAISLNGRSAFPSFRIPRPEAGIALATAGDDQLPIWCEAATGDWSSVPRKHLQ
jgi:hypothetical protein